MDDRLVEFGRRAAATTRRATLDAALGRVARALVEAEVACVLLKGAAVAGWLYGPGEARRYEDLDLLVAEDNLEPAGRALGSLGFAPRVAPEPLLSVNRHHLAWECPADGVLVELHWTLVGVGQPPGVAWGILSERTDRILVGGVEVRVLSAAARTLHLALHSAQHEGAVGPLEDLERGIARLEFGVWDAARDLAGRLDAMSAFAAGLRSSPEGAALAVRLGLPAASAYWTLRAGGAPAGAGRLWYLRNASGWRDRWRLTMWFLPQTRAGAPSARRFAGLGDVVRVLRAGGGAVHPAIGRRRRGVVARRLVRPGPPATGRRWGRLRRDRPRG
jgi:hypothetical protein